MLNAGKLILNDRKPTLNAGKYILKKGKCRLSDGRLIRYAGKKRQQIMLVYDVMALATKGRNCLSER